MSELDFLDSGHYPTRGEFLSALAAEERGLEEDKKHVAAMAPKWRAEQQRRFEEAFEQWKADRHRREARLFAEANGEQDGQKFPPPIEHVRRLSTFG